MYLYDDGVQKRGVMSTVLIVDDEKDIVNALEIYLKPEGYDILKAYDGKEAVKTVKENSVDLVLMDIMMPNMDGIQATSEIREFSNVPIIFLSAKSEDTDKILGLNIGADDYVTKPFNPSEVVARVKSQLRRYTTLGAHTSVKLLVNGSIEMNDDEKIVKVDGNVISLTPVEYDILKLLLENPGKVFSSSDIYEKIWNEPFMSGENTVAVHIRHLREKVEINPSEPRYIKVVWGRGYKMEKEHG